ncbi:MAG: hypothetical protein JJU22_04735 [Gammaproteobacteria bacterium]|nr:hypothetical protein [Gammaproteobacteria bacterium]
MSGLAHILERKGIATVLIGLVPQHVERIKPPRALLVPFEMGRPLGDPGNRDFQARVLSAALRLAVRSDVPVIDVFEEDAPAPVAADMEGWACPVSLRSPAGTGSTPALLAEIELLEPWCERARVTRGRTGVGASGMHIEEVGRFLLACCEREPVASPVSGLPVADAFKLAAEDLKLFYLEAATARPGAGSTVLADWFWQDTAAGALLLELSRALADAENPGIRIHARATLVPEARRG